MEEPEGWVSERRGARMPVVGPFMIAERRAATVLVALAVTSPFIDFSSSEMHTPCGALLSNRNYPYSYYSAWNPSEVCGAQRSGAVMVCIGLLMLAAAVCALRSRAPAICVLVACVGVAAAVYAARRAAEHPINSDGSLLGPTWNGAQYEYTFLAVACLTVALYLWFRERRPIEEDEAT